MAVMKASRERPRGRFVVPADTLAAGRAWAYARVVMSAAAAASTSSFSLAFCLVLNSSQVSRFVSCDSRAGERCGPSGGYEEKYLRRDDFTHGERE